MSEHILKQTELPFPISVYGCAFNTLLEKAQRLSGYILSRKEHDRIWLEAVDLGYIGNADSPYKFNCSAPIINLAFKVCGSYLEALAIGTFVAGKMFYYSGYENEKYHKDLEFMQKIKAANSSGTHFRGVDRFGKVIWEPWSSPVECLGIYYSICYHIRRRD